jgi:hypothetical protein
MTYDFGLVKGVKDFALLDSLPSVNRMSPSVKTTAWPIIIVTGFSY